MLLRLKPYWIMLDINDDISQRTSESTSYVCYFLSIQIIENMWLEIIAIRSRAVTERLSRSTWATVTRPTHELFTQNRESQLSTGSVWLILKDHAVALTFATAVGTWNLPSNIITFLLIWNRFYLVISVRFFTIKKNENQF